ncbi:MAG: SAM-dependent methyltransferase, partial [Anaerolineae bacterium]
HVEQLLPIPEDCTGETNTPAGDSAYPVDPFPFNHPTKIAILHSRE